MERKMEQARREARGEKDRKKSQNNKDKWVKEANR